MTDDDDEERKERIKNVGKIIEVYHELFGAKPFSDVLSSDEYSLQLCDRLRREFRPDLTNRALLDAVRGAIELSEIKVSNFELGTSQGVIEWVKQRADDIEKVEIPLGTIGLLPDGTRIRTLSGRPGMVIHIMNDVRALLCREDAELLLNDGVLSRMHIPIEISDRIDSNPV